MLAKIKDAKKIRATLAAQNELEGPDDVCHTPLHCYLRLIGLLTYYGIHSAIELTLTFADNARCNCSDK